MFNKCVATKTKGSSVNSDNMTCIIIKFKSNISKRSASPHPESGLAKHPKTDENVPQEE